MGGLWDFLLANPILFFILAAWVLGGIGNVIKSRNDARRRQERAERREDRPTTTASTSSTAASSMTRRDTQATRDPEPAPMRQARRSGGGSAGQPRSQDDVAAEMRRLLGLDPVEDPATTPRPRPEPQSASQQRRVEPPPVPAQAARSAFQPLGNDPAALSPKAPAKARFSDKRVNPHVGEWISSRTSDYQGQVGKHDKEWGSLGGRHTERKPIAPPIGGLGPPAGVDRLVDLQDIKRMILGAEILGPPLALRDPDQQRLV